MLEVGGETLVLTHDMIVEGVHYLPGDPPGDVAWKLVAVNLSDLAAKGARPLGVLLGFTLGDGGLGPGLRRRARHGARAPSACPCSAATRCSAPARVLGLTAIGRAAGPVPSRGGARPGDLLWVSGTIGDAGAACGMLRGRARPRRR